MPDRNVQIIACAGSGKTEVISRGIAEIIKRGAAPSSIVAFTFTEKAAEELKARIRYILSLEGHRAATIGDMYAGTIHSFCFETLKELRPHYRSYDVLDEASRIAYLSKPFNYYKNIGLVGIEKSRHLSKYNAISKFISAYEIVLNEGISLRKLANRDEQLCNCIKRYYEILKEDRYLDFSSMIHELVEQLEKKNSEAAKKLHQKIKYVVVDEYQDINGLQERLIHAIKGRGAKITVVGDDDQGIYGWRGAVVDYIKNFKSGFTNVKTVRLEENFRSTQGVVDLANKYIKKNKNRLSKTMIPKFPMAYEKSDIQYQHFDTVEEQAEYIINHIRELVGSDFLDKSGKRFALALGDIGILVRRNDEAARLIPHMKNAGIECVVDSGESGLDQEISHAVLNALDWVFGISDEKVNHIGSSFLDAVRRKGRQLPDLKSIAKGLSDVKKQLDQVAQKGNRDYLPDLGLQGVYHDLLAVLGVPEIGLGEGEHLCLAAISQAISDYEKVWQRLRHVEYKYFRGFVWAWANHSYSMPSTLSENTGNAVKIMTIHKAKGLEFPVVFVPYLIKKQKRRSRTLVPEDLYDVNRYHGDLEDERRVYYVALTRAQKYLFLSGIKNDPSVKRPRLPADMVSELDSKLLSVPMKLKPPKSGLEERRRGHSFSTTFTKLSAYGRCGYDYKLRHLYGYNAGVPAFFGYGTQIHNILNLIHTEYRDSDLEDKKIAELVDKNFHLRYAPGDMDKTARVAAERVIKNYVHNHSEEFPTILETEKSFEAALGDALVVGQIDLIKEVDPDTNHVKKVAVIDFKSDTELLYKTDSQHQVRLYVEAANQVLGFDPVEAAIHDLDSGINKEVAIGETEVQGTLEELTRRIDGIRSGDFTPVRRKRICSDCDYCRICEHAKLD